jgi:hypothetical protein
LKLVNVKVFIHARQSSPSRFFQAIECVAD